MAELLTTEAFKEKVFDYTAGGEWKYKGSIPGIIDFYAEWCGPCKMIAPIIEEMAKKYAGKLNVWKVDTDAEPELAMQFGISSIPSILIIPLSGTPQMRVGSMSKAALEKIIEGDLGISG
ncbi:MAG: thioredoxin [Spirochaeta sp. LUC14_002_19_P3]|nr:MAG: thioredoxin [Spirochaeta sp. LUC14_002_19_P3]